MKKIIILAIALLSTGIVFSETILRREANVKPAVVKIDKNATVEHSVAGDAIATGD